MAGENEPCRTCGGKRWVTVELLHATSNEPCPNCSEEPRVTTADDSKNKYRASNSFRDEEVNAMLQLFDKLYKGGDVSTIVRSDPCSKVWAKFKKMRDNLDAKTT